MRATRRSKPRPWRAVVTAILTAAAIGACSDSSTPQPSAAVLADLDEAIDDLELGLYAAAKARLEPLIDPGGDEFADLSRDRQALDRARVAYVLANSFNQINVWAATFGRLVELLGPFLGTAPAFDPAAPPTAADLRTALITAAGTGLIAPTLDGFVRGFVEFFGENLAILDDVKENPDFALELRQLPLRIGDADLADLGGEYDLGEVYMLDAMIRLVDGLLTLVLGVDLTIGIPDTDVLTHLVVRISTLGTENHLVDDLSNLLAVIFLTQPRLLEIGATGIVQDGGTLLGDGLTSFLRGLEFMAAEADEQDDDLIGYLPGDGPGDDDAVEVHIDFDPQPVPGIDTTQLSNLEIAITPETLNGLENVRDAFGGVPGVRVNWARDLVPLLALSVTTILETGALDGLIDEALNQANLDASTRQSIRGLIDSDFVNANLIEGLILGFIPDVLEFDVAAYFDQPTSLRDFMPYWTPAATAAVTATNEHGETVTTYESDWSTPRLLLEYECDDGDGNPFDPPTDGWLGIACASGGAVDEDHFDPLDPRSPFAGLVTDPEFRELHTKAKAGRLQELDAGGPADGIGANRLDAYVPNSDGYGLRRDGVETPLFYTAFRDPTFGGMLWIRLDSNAIKSPEGQDEMAPYGFSDTRFHPATNRSLNALIQGLFGELLETVGAL